MRRGVAAVTAIVCAIAMVIGLVASGWTPENAKNSVIPSKEDIAWHDYTEPGVTSNGNRMPDGTVINPWEATEDLEGNERFKAIMSELRARVNPDDKRKRPSPALLAEHAFDAQERSGFDILGKHKDEKDPNTVQEYFMHDPAYAREVYAKLDTIWRSAIGGEIIEDYPYVSAFYMEHDAITIDGKPAPKVVAAESRLIGGHFIRLRVRDSEGRIVDLVYRLECGFQPVNITVPTNHEPVIDNPPSSEPESNPDPGPGPGPDPDPDPKPDPKPDPDPEPKDPNGGYQGQHPNNPDTGGGKNKESDTKETKDPEPEKNSPSEYKAPDPPKADDGGNSGGGNSGGGNSGGGNSGGTNSNKEASKNTDSGSKTVDQDNGKQESYKDPDTGKDSSGKVRAGDGEKHSDYSEHVDKSPEPKESHADPEPKSSGGGGDKDSGSSDDSGNGELSEPSIE